MALFLSVWIEIIIEDTNITARQQQRYAVIISISIDIHQLSHYLVQFRTMRYSCMGGLRACRYYVYSSIARFMRHHRRI